MEYVAAQPGLAGETLQQYRKLNHPMTKRQNKERLVNVLRSEIHHRQNAGGDDWWDDLENIVDQVADQYHDEYNDVQDDFRTSIYQAHVYDATAAAGTTTLDPADHLDMESIHPIKFPVWELQQTDVEADESTGDYELVTSEDTTPQNLPTDGWEQMEAAGPRMITMITTRLDTRRDLADTGATISATGIKSILHRFQSYLDYEIKGYDGQITKAAGQGFAKIYNPETKQIDEMLFVYTPTVTGTIISLEHHAKTHPRIHKWIQEATPSDDRGKITFLAADDTVISEYPTTRSQGLYYIQDLHFVPAQEIDSTTAQTDSLPAITAAATIHTMRVTIPPDSSRSIDTDYTPDIDTEHIQHHLLQDQRTPATTINVLSTPALAERMSREVQKYELWQQRLGYAPLARLIRTSKRVQGLPPLSPANIPTFVKCRACEIAKLKKAPPWPPCIGPCRSSDRTIFPHGSWLYQRAGELTSRGGQG